MAVPFGMLDPEPHTHWRANVEPNKMANAPTAVIVTTKAEL